MWGESSDSGRISRWGEEGNFWNPIKKSQKHRRTLNFSFNSSVSNQKVSITVGSHPLPPRSRQPYWQHRKILQNLRILCVRGFPRAISCYFIFVSKPGFEQQKKVLPLFLRNVWPDRAENFSTNTNGKSGWLFFFLVEILFLSNLAGLTKFRWSKKPGFLIRSLVFCFSWPVKTIFFKREKNTRSDWVLVVIEKVSARTNQLLNFAWGKTFGHFWPLWPPKTPWRKHLRILVLRRNLLYSLRSIYPESR